MSQRPYGVLGRVLGHSYTPVIYRELAGLDYVRFEREPEQLGDFLAGDEWEGTNVTIPYKRAVLPYLSEMSDRARRLGNVNTITRLPDGRLKGDNTDYYGFKCLVESFKMDFAGKRAAVFGGSGGAGTTAMAVLEDMGINPVAISRKGPNSYGNLPHLGKFALAVNCTPAGMYPDCPASPCDLSQIEGLEALVDIVYNPARTGLMLQAEHMGIPSVGGLLMLVAQAAEAVFCYTGETISLDRVVEVTQRLSATEQNIAFIGMPGCGKSTVGNLVAQKLGKSHVDIDVELEKRIGCTCSEFILTHGEKEFRRQESACLSNVAKASGQVISCGGGIVTQDGNLDLLRQNSIIVMLDRPLDQLATKDRPITARDGIEALANKRLPLYRSWSDIAVTSRETAELTAKDVLAALPPMLERIRA